jgi:mono/diheme cytochrome c family protein
MRPLRPLLLLASPLVAADAPKLAPDAAGYAKTVAPVFAAHCNKCHTGEKPKGDFDTAAAELPNDFLDLTAKGKWREVVNGLNAHSMPPKKEKQPTATEVAAVVDWITAQAVRAELARRDTAGSTAPRTRTRSASGSAWTST